MALWPLFVGLPIFIGAIIFLLSRGKESREVYNQINSKLAKEYGNYASQNGFNYSEKDNFGLTKKLYDTFTKSWKGANYMQYRFLSHIMNNNSMYFFRSLTRITNTTSEDNSVCLFESNIEHKDAIWIRSYNFYLNNLSEKQEKAVKTISKYMSKIPSIGLFGQKEFKLNLPFFESHKIFYSGSENKVKIYATENIFKLISELENLLNLQVSVEVRGRFIAIYTKGRNSDYNFEKGFIQPTGKFGEYGYLRRKEEIDIFLKYAKEIHRYFGNY